MNTGLGFVRCRVPDRPGRLAPLAWMPETSGGTNGKCLPLCVTKGLFVDLYELLMAAKMSRGGTKRRRR